MPKEQVNVPSTLKRSPKKAQDTYADTLSSAEAEYHDESRAHRTAWSAVKHSFEKVGDHWERKEGGRRGPSDPHAAKSGAAARKPEPTAGGVDEGASKAHLMELARKADVPGRSRMTKHELVQALQKANNRETRRARS